MMISSCRKDRVIFVGVLALTFASAQTRAASGPNVAFENESTLQTEKGDAQLKWEGDHELLFYQLESAMEPDFIEPTREYEGTNEASFRSGLTDGRYYFRVRARQSENDPWGPWSESVEIICEHHSLTYAWSLFAAGALMFLCIVYFVVTNARNLDRFERNNA